MLVQATPTSIPSRRSMQLAVLLIGIAACGTPDYGAEPTLPLKSTSEPRDYRFDGMISRTVLGELLVALDHHGRHAQRPRRSLRQHSDAQERGHKVHRPQYLPLGAGSGADANLERAKQLVPSVLAADPEMILQACVFESVSTQVEQVGVPEWAFMALGRPIENRNFRYADMIYPEGQRRNWGRNASVPDVSRDETKLWFYFSGRKLHRCRL